MEVSGAKEPPMAGDDTERGSAPARSKRRFAITGADRCVGVLDAFVQNGWEPLTLFTMPTDDVLDTNTTIVRRAQELGMRIQMSRIDERALAHLADVGCDVLVVAGYPCRIEGWQRHVSFAVNFHPSLLPRYRGPHPLVHAILNDEQTWGVTCHRLADDIDCGDILAQRGFALAADECHESLDLKVQMCARTLAAEIARDFDRLWALARPQDEGTYQKRWTLEERTLDFHRTARELARQLRAFGRIECLATINDVCVHVSRAVTWCEKHSHAPGRVVHADGLNMVVSCQDGYVGILEWHMFPPGAPTTSRRHR